MHVDFACPACQQPQRRELVPEARDVRCEACGWRQTVDAADTADDRPARCLVCGCGDLWRQKDFPPQLGLTMVGLGALLSTIAWAMYWPVVAIGILMAFALVDLLLYTLMSDVLVCYRCDSRYRRANLEADGHPRFNLETAERYRQETLRLEQAASAVSASGRAVRSASGGAAETGALRPGGTL